MKHTAQTGFSWNTATAMLDSFSRVSGIQCRLHNEKGELLYEQGGETDGCAFCRKMMQLTEEEMHCERIHQHGALEAERFGGRYIYFCPSGLAYFSSPILTAGRLVGALVGGPVLIMDTDDFLDGKDFSALDAAGERELAEALEAIPKLEPNRLSDLSAQLFANAVLISDDTNTFFLSQQRNRRQNAIGDFIRELKEQDTRPDYPLESEQLMQRAIAKKDYAMAEEQLERLMGHIYASSEQAENAADRTVDLVVMMGRGVLMSGAQSAPVFDLCSQGIQALRLHTGRGQQEQILNELLRRLVGAVTLPVDSRHTTMVRKALGYMRRNCHRKLAVREVADYVGYSPSHFSRSFREEYGATFQESLNRLRVERSKPLLLESGSSVAEVGGLVGIPDQSYFCKVFKAVEGVTPDQYRKRRRRIDTRKEYGD